MATYTLTNGNQVASSPPYYLQPPLWLLPTVFGKAHQYGFSFNLLENPRSAADLVLGRPVELVSYTLPRLNVPIVNYDQPYDVPVAPGVSISGHVQISMNLSAGATFGFDTFGIQTGKFLDGLYVRSVDVTLVTSLAASSQVNVGLWNVVEVYGGVRGNGTNTISVNQQSPVRFAAIPALDKVFAVSASIDYNLSAFAGIRFWFGWSPEFPVTIASGHIPIF